MSIPLFAPIERFVRSRFRRAARDALLDGGQIAEESTPEIWEMRHAAL
jgi:hypothetical protein